MVRTKQSARSTHATHTMVVSLNSTVEGVGPDIEEEGWI
jgi:hypothetical protein